MSWSLFRERNAFMARIIGRGAENPDTALDFSSEELGELERLFGDEDRLLLAMRQRWMTTLNAKLDQATYDGKSIEQTRAELAAAQPGLRAVLDAAARRSVRVRSMQLGEQQMVDYFSGPNHPRRHDVVA